MIPPVSTDSQGADSCATFPAEPVDALTRKRELIKLIQAKKKAKADRKILDFQPTMIQRLVLLAKEKILLVLGANRCIGGMEEIYDPIAKKHRRVDSITEPFFVYAWDGEKPVIARAGIPFMKGLGTLNRYRFSSGETLLAFGTHRALSPSGYQPIGDKLHEGASFLHLSTSDISRQALCEDVQRWLKRVRDFLADCFSYLRLCGEQLREEEGNAQDAFPSLTDAQEHISSSAYGNKDGLVCTKERIRLRQLIDRPSILDDLQPTLGQFADILSSVFCRLSLLDGDQFRVGQLSNLASDLLESIPESVRLGRYNYVHSLKVSSIESIEQIDVDVKWDFEVKGFQNYIHKGLIHHNSGKSEIIAVDSQIRLTGVVPEAIKDEYPPEFIQAGEAWLTGMDFVSLMGIVKRKVDKFLPSKLNAGYNKENKVQVYTNGSEIQYRSYDQGREKFQGTSKNYVSFDEEPPQDVYDEGYMRTVDCSGLIRLAFTPLKGLTWAYKNLYKRARRIVFTENIHGLKEDIGIVHSPEEIKLLRERKIMTITNNGPEIDDDIVVYQMSIYDNPYLPDAEVWKAERKYAEDPANYNARILGRFTTISGRNVFDSQNLLRRQPNCPKPKAIGEIERGQFKLNLRGRLLIFKDLKDIHEDNYVIGADVAEGLEIGDYSCAQILSKKTAEQVAVWHGKCSPEEFAGVLVDLGKFFNLADIAPERNFHGFAVVARIREHYKYKNLFSEYDYSNLEKVSSGKSMVKRFGWDTNAKTKPLMIQELGEFIRNGHIRLNDTSTIDELITYVYDRNGKTEAMEGCYDDRVIALAIALQVFLKRKIIRQPISINKDSRRNPYTGY